MASCFAQLSRASRKWTSTTSYLPTLTPAKISRTSGIPWARSLSVYRAVSNREPLFTVQRAPTQITNEVSAVAAVDGDVKDASTNATSGPDDHAIKTPYHLSMSKDGADAKEYHYHPESYPEGVTDEKSFYEEQQEEPYVDDYDEDDIRNGILEAALELVPTHGWTKAAIVAAAESYGYPGIAHGMFPGGAADLANYFYAKCNAELREQLEAESGEPIPSQTAFVRDATIRRLQMTLAVKDTWPDAMAAMASPEGVKGALNNLYELCDDIWYYAGDKSTDTNWYTKRALLAAVYKSTEFYMLQDTSPNHEATWDYLERALTGAVDVGTNFRLIRQSAENVVGSLFGAATTAANLMGVKN